MDCYQPARRVATSRGSRAAARLASQHADQNGRIHREKVGPFIKQAQSAYQKRKSEVREGKFFPENVRQRPILFSEMAQDFLDYSK